HPAGKEPGQSSFTAEAGLFVNTRDRSGAASPDLQFHVLGRLPALPPPLAAFINPPPSYFLICPTLCKPQSRGQLALRSNRPEVDPVIRFNYLQCPADMDVLLSGLDLSQQLAETAAISQFRDGAPPFAIDGAGRHRVVPGGDAAARREFVAATATTVWHPAGTCKMGRDVLSVVDPALRVHGVDGLRVADSSVIPVAPSGNTNAACIMIGERCAALILGREPSSAGPPPGRERGEDRAEAPPAYAQAIHLLGQLGPACAVSGLRYWARVAELWGRAMPAVAKTLLEADPLERPGALGGAVLDELRAGLRELAELPGEESRRLLAELERLAGAVRPDARAPAADDAEAPWRRWNVKP
ncbi:MAG TPA: GMC oxidoreductase, partial [Candidatus Methylomirabilis sp.]|nr:GMC oxidoreductase [Candidatus Methylomirabilis sp.]